MQELTVKNYMDILNEDYKGEEIQWKEEVCWKYRLSEELIELLDKQNKINWKCILKYQKLSEDFIERHSDKVYWRLVSECQTLSEEFMERNSNKVSWFYISLDQIFSLEFLLRNKDRIDASCLLSNKNFSDSFWKDIRVKMFFSKQEEDVKAQYLKKIKEIK